jgi:hypothetical protein
VNLGVVRAEEYKKSGKIPIYMSCLTFKLLSLVTRFRAKLHRAPTWTRPALATVDPIIGTSIQIRTGSG